MSPKKELHRSLQVAFTSPKYHTGVRQTSWAYRPQTVVLLHEGHPPKGPPAFANSHIGLFLTLAGCDFVGAALRDRVVCAE